LKAFRHDIGLLCNNCRTYNEDGSFLWVDANSIEVCFVHSLYHFWIILTCRRNMLL
jgi:ATP-dependent helicase STH1/SNF2